MKNDFVIINGKNMHAKLHTLIIVDRNNTQKRLMNYMLSLKMLHIMLHFLNI